MLIKSWMCATYEYLLGRDIEILTRAHGRSPKLKPAALIIGNLLTAGSLSLSLSLYLSLSLSLSLSLLLNNLKPNLFSNNYPLFLLLLWFGWGIAAIGE